RNDAHRTWASRKLCRELGELKDKRIAVLGLTYKPGTDTLRRSLAIEICQSLIAEGALIHGFDPVVKDLPANLPIKMHHDAASAVTDVDGAIVCTEWPEFKLLDWPALVKLMRKPIVVDANAFLAANLAGDSAIRYFGVGLPPRN